MDIGLLHLVGFYENMMRVYYDSGVADRAWGDFYGGIRPIVCLKADVKLVKTDANIGVENAECFMIQ